MPACGSSAPAAPVSKHRGGGGRGDELRAGQLLQPRDAADMVEMLVAVEQDT